MLVNKEMKTWYEKESSGRLLEAEKPAFETFIWLTGPESVEILGEGGFDFVVIDIKHGPHGQDKLSSLLRALAMPKGYSP